MLSLNSGGPVSYRTVPVRIVGGVAGLPENGAGVMSTAEKRLTSAQYITAVSEIFAPLNADAHMTVSQCKLSQAACKDELAQLIADSATTRAELGAVQPPTALVHVASLLQGAVTQVHDGAGLVLSGIDMHSGSDIRAGSAAMQAAQRELVAAVSEAEGATAGHF